MYYPSRCCSALSPSLYLYSSPLLPKTLCNDARSDSPASSISYLETLTSIFTTCLSLISMFSPTIHFKTGAQTQKTFVSTLVFVFILSLILSWKHFGQTNNRSSIHAWTHPSQEVIRNATLGVSNHRDSCFQQIILTLNSSKRYSLSFYLIVATADNL